MPTKPEVAAERLEHFSKLEHLTLEPGVALRICEAKKGVPRDCLGVLYDLSFDGNEISLAAVEAHLGAGQ